MKIRTDFVTNSSSSSFIICFARIENSEKASAILSKYNIEQLTAEEVDEEKNWSGFLGADWAGAVIYGVDDILSRYPNDKFVVIKDGIEAEYGDYGDPIYNYNFDANDAISEITKDNGFTDIDVAMGEGRDG